MSDLHFDSAPPHHLAVPLAPKKPQEQFVFGSASGPGGTIHADATSLLKDGQRWVPVMGEFHYARYPESEWREELLKLAAGGINLIATYIFWIHHEELPGKWNWTGQRNLRRFIDLCGELGLPLFLRVGPWCHGEVRNGGIPDWVVAAGPTRQDDHDYLSRVKPLYAQIAEQARGKLWKDGGPVIGVQIENEYGGEAQHLMTLKRLAIQAGLDVPLYTRTGWPHLATTMPHGELLPLYGCYAEGFWDRTLEPMPATYWTGFAFYLQRTDQAIANERLTNKGDEEGSENYPFLTCEVGGGMQVSYHRRIRFDPRDAVSVILTRLGAGSNLPGYYMAHGGTNPDGLTTLQESQATHEWNDVPVKSYDFQTLLGEFGQTREQYHSLRPFHLFLGDFGPAFSTLPPYLPDHRPTGKNDTDTLRWAIRSDGERGYVFVNNYQRLQQMPAKPGTKLTVSLADGRLVEFPEVKIPEDSAFFWPFNMAINGVNIHLATAQPVCRVGDTVVFCETPGVPTSFQFDGGARITSSAGRMESNGGKTTVSEIQPGRDLALTAQSGDQLLHILVLSLADVKQLYRGVFQGQDHLIFSAAGVIFDGDKLRLRCDAPAEPTISIFPPKASLIQDEIPLPRKSDGIFATYSPRWPTIPAAEVRVTQVREAKPARTIRMGSEGVAEAPTDLDFEAASVWQLELTPQAGQRLRIRYVGDVARISENGRLLCDNFFNGTPFEFGTWRSSDRPELEILPLSKDAPIMLLDGPAFGDESSIARLEGIEVIQERVVELG